MFIGLVSLLLRIIMTVIMALVFIGRLDQPAVQRNWETLDAGYAVYLGYHGFLEGNTHPVLLVSLQFFLAGPAGERYRQRIKHGGEHQAQLTQNDKIHVMQNSKFRAQWRWQFAYCLVKNPSLVYYRLSLEKKLEKQERMKQQKPIQEEAESQHHEKTLPGFEVEEVQI